MHRVSHQMIPKKGIGLKVLRSENYGSTTRKGYDEEAALLLEMFLLPPESVEEPEANY